MLPTEPNGASSRDDATKHRARILNAAFEVLSTQGYGQTSMLEIATRAKVSKRDLYASVGSKREMLVACVTEKAGRLVMRVAMPEAPNLLDLEATLSVFGERLVREVSEPDVLGLFRLAIAAADRAPEVAQVLDGIGREAARRELTALFINARTAGLLNGDPAEMVEQFLSLLWGDLLMRLLLRVAEAPNSEDAQHRASKAARSFLLLQQAGIAVSDGT